MAETFRRSPQSDDRKGLVYIRIRALHEYVASSDEQGRGARMIIRRAHEMVGGDLGAGLSRRPEAGNALLSVRTQVADYALDAERLALLCAWNGRQEVAKDGRRVFVDDDTWLAVPAASATVRI